MALNAGVMEVTLEYAKDLKDRDWFCKMDPYCIVRVGGQTFRSKTAASGGRNPVWNETFKFSVINENDVNIDLKDDDIGRDEYIGSVAFTLARARELGSDRISVPVTSKRSQKQHGFISIALKWTQNMALSEVCVTPLPQSAPVSLPAAPASPPCAPALPPLQSPTYPPSAPAVPVYAPPLPPPQPQYAPPPQQQQYALQPPQQGYGAQVYSAPPPQPSYQQQQPYQAPSPLTYVQQAPTYVAAQAPAPPIYMARPQPPMVVVEEMPYHHHHHRHHHHRDVEVVVVESDPFW